MLPLAVDVLARTSVLLAAAWLAATILRRHSASVRAMVWTSALTGVLILPALTSLTPRLNVPIWRAPDASLSLVAGAQVAQPELRATAGRVTAGVEAAAVIAPDRVISASSTSSPGAALPSWSDIAFVLWGLVALVLLLRIARSHVTLSRLARTADAEAGARDALWAPLVDDVRAHLSIRRTVHVRTTDAVGVPAVAGVLRPVLLLPADAGEWDADVRRAVVLHELAHVARWDAAGQLVSQLACAAYWCVPLVWHGARRAAALREQASDDVVLMSGVRASAYARNLLNVAHLPGSVPLEPAALAMARPDRIKERIVAILDPAPSRKGLRAHSRFAIILAAAMVVALVATLQPVTQAAVAPVGPVEPVEPALPQSSCQKDMRQTSSSRNDDGRTQVWTVKMSGADCKVEMRVDGTVEFNDTFTDVKSLSSGGTFRLDVTEGGVRRELAMVQRGNSLSRLYKVDGRERAFDTEALAWFGQFLIVLDRQTAVGVDTRLPHLLTQGGVEAVLKETALMSSDHARGRYYTKLVEARTLTDAARARVLTQAAALTSSDHYASELLKIVGGAGFQDTAVRAAAMAMIDKMDSDHYRSTAVAGVIGAGRPTAGDMDVLVRTAERIDSDHYKLEVLRRIVGGPLQPQHRVALARAARTIDSDHYAGEFLKALVGPDANAVERQVFLDVITTIGSDHYRNEAIQTLLAVHDLTEADLLTLVAVVPPRGDHYKSESLKGVARHRNATDQVRAAVLDASARMSSHYRDKVRRAVGK